MILEAAMFAFLTKLLLVVRSRLRSQAGLQAENLALRQQVLILSRRSRSRVRLRNLDRLEAFPWNEAPRHLIRDRDGSFGPAYIRRIRAMGVRDHPTAPRSPWEKGHVERLIGSIRRECLDHIVVFGEADLCRILKDYASYYNRVRTHLSLSKDAPLFRRRHKVGSVATIPILGGLHLQYVRI